MPATKTIQVTVGSNEYNYVNRGVENGVSTFSMASDSFEANSFIVGIRKSNAKQVTRKSTITYNDPLFCGDVCDANFSQRGSIHYRLENIVSRESSLEERELAYDRFVALLSDVAVREAVVRNEPFF